MKFNVDLMFWENITSNYHSPLFHLPFSFQGIIEYPFQCLVGALPPVALLQTEWPAENLDFKRIGRKTLYITASLR
jgi:hypothetical protein